MSWTTKRRREIRDFLAERDGKDCHYCGKPLIIQSKAKKKPTNFPHIEHKLARENGGSDDMDNLCLSCKHCNTRKGTKDYDKFVEEEYHRVKKHYETIKNIIEKGVV